MSPDPARVAGKTVGGYVIEEYVGSGAAGDVYRATRGSEEFAVKFYKTWLFREDKDAAGKRMARELDIRTIGHRNLCRIIDAGSFGARAQRRFLVMEFVHGSNLTEKIDNQPLPWERFLNFGLQLIHGVQRLHDRKFVHRDIKPDNIMIEKESDRLVLGDFGVVRRLLDYSATVTKSSQFLGTLRYAAPEWVFRIGADSAENPAIDVYSIGATFLQMMTGSRPLPDTVADEQVLYRLARAYRHNITSPEYPLRIEHLVRRMLATRTEARPSLDECLAVLKGEEEDRSELGDPLARLMVALGQDPEAAQRRSEEDQEEQRRIAFKRIAQIVKARWTNAHHGNIETHPLRSIAGIRSVTFEENLLSNAFFDWRAAQRTHKGPAPAKRDDKRLANVHELVQLFPDVQSWNYSFGIKVITYDKFVGGGIYYVVDVGQGGDQVTVLRLLATFGGGKPGSIVVDESQYWIGDLETMGGS
jgi:serine/threonine-protein kinase